MQTIICLMLVSFGLGVDAEGGTALEVVTGLSFFFGSVGLAQPVIRGLSAFAAARFPLKKPTMRRVRR